VAVWIEHSQIESGLRHKHKAKKVSWLNNMLTCPVGQISRTKAGRLTAETEHLLRQPGEKKLTILGRYGAVLGRS
jgi:hypothetical protein